MNTESHIYLTDLGAQYVSKQTDNQHITGKEHSSNNRFYNWTTHASSPMYLPTRSGKHTQSCRCAWQYQQQGKDEQGTI
eukprot:6491609-Amphidinium_carterae.1